MGAFGGGFGFFNNTSGNILSVRNDGLTRIGGVVDIQNDSGLMGIGYAGFGAGSGLYAIEQSSTFETYINSATAKPIHFRINNVELITMNATEGAIKINKRSNLFGSFYNYNSTSVSGVS